MEKYFEILKKVDLFKGIEEAEFRPLLSCLKARVLRFEKNQTVYLSGEATNDFGIVLSGQVQVIKDDYYGNRSILAVIEPAGLFGESFACAEIKALPVSVIATTESELLFIDCRRMESPCSNACGFHRSLIHNMLGSIAKKNVALTQKIEFTSKRTTREKLLSYLSAEAQKAKSSFFSIPLNRQELADFLFIDRSAMSFELSKLRKEGVLNFHKNEFELISKTPVSS